MKHKTKIARAQRDLDRAHVLFHFYGHVAQGVPLRSGLPSPTIIDMLEGAKQRFSQAWRVLEHVAPSKGGHGVSGPYALDREVADLAWAWHPLDEREANVSMDVKVAAHD